MLALQKRMKDKDLDLVLQGRITTMLAMLQLYMAGNTSWLESSRLAAVNAGKGNGLARSLHKWLWDFLEDHNNLPLSLYGLHNKSQPDDEDIAQEIQLHLQSRSKYISAMDVVRYLKDPEVLARFNMKKIPSEWTAHHWLAKMQFHCGEPVNGMYIDGHKRPDVVEYHQKVFLCSGLYWKSGW